MPEWKGLQGQCCRPNVDSVLQLLAYDMGLYLRAAKPADNLEA